MLVGDGIDGLLVDTRGDQDGALALGQLAQGIGQRRELGTPVRHIGRVQVIRGFIHQRLHLGTGQHPAVGDALVFQAGVGELCTVLCRCRKYHTLRSRPTAREY